MMLSDKAELIKAFKKAYDDGRLMTFEDVIDVLESVPELVAVEAIPVEWLERNYANNGLYCTEKYKKRAKVVKEIIDDWRARQCV